MYALAVETTQEDPITKTEQFLKGTSPKVDNRPLTINPQPKTLMMPLPEDGSPCRLTCCIDCAGIVYSQPNTLKILGLRIIRAYCISLYLYPFISL